MSIPMVNTGGTADAPKKKPIIGIKIKGVPPPAKLLTNQLAELARVSQKIATGYSSLLTLFLFFLKLILTSNQ
jgi:hypothetical protein